MPYPSTIKDPQHEIQIFTRRTIVIAVFILLLSSCLIARLIYLQVYQYQTYTTLSQKNLLSLDPLEPKRGLIYDRNGVLLAVNIPVFSLEIRPRHVKKIEETLAELSKIIHLTDDHLRMFHKQLKQCRRYEAVPLRTRLTEEEVARFSIDQFRFPGVQIKARLIRHYPFGAIMAPVLGYVGRINERELARVDPTNYSATNYIGKVGVEKYFETELHGKVGYQQAESDAAGRIIRVLKRTDPIPGNHLYLSVDSRLQRIASEAFQHVRGAAVAIDPSTGHILALVNSPSYDPNLFVDGISQKAFKALQQDPDKPLYNRATRGQYPPGSTVKPFLALAGLAAGIITPHDTVHDPGWFRINSNSRIYHDWQRHGHGTVNLSHAIRVSCDIYFYQLALKLGIHRMGDIFRQFKFGESTSVEINEELPGLIPSPDWKKRVHKQAWYLGDTVITGIGQGFMLATPLQLAQATAILANRGQGFKSTLLLGRQFIHNQFVRQAPIPLTPINLANQHWQTVIDAMQTVISQGTGAKRFGNDASYSVAGKTGTIQVYSLKQNERYDKNKVPIRLRDNSAFIVFAPVNKPRIAVAVITEHDDMAGKIARKIVDGYLHE